MGKTERQQLEKQQLREYKHNRKLQLDETIGQNVVAARKLMGLSRDELAELMELTTSHMGLIERGERGATAITLSKLSAVFNMPVDSFFAETGNKPSYTEENNDSAAMDRRKIMALVPRLDAPGTSVALLMIQGIVRLNFIHKNGR